MDDFPINWPDLVILAVILVSGFIAFSRGFIREALSIASWIGAALAGVHGYPLLLPQIADLVPDPTLAPWVAGVGIGVVTVVVLSLAAHYLATLVHLTGLSAVDRSLGFLFGLVRGALLVSLVFLVLQWMVDRRDYPNWLNAAKALPIAHMGADLLARLLPSDLRPALSKLDAEAERATKDLILERLVSPPANSAAPAEKPGYTDEQRKGLNRVIEGMQ